MRSDADVRLGVMTMLGRGVMPMPGEVWHRG